MNPRRVHQLMLRHFPKLEALPQEWRVLMHGSACSPSEVLAFLRETFDSEPILVEVHRKVGGAFPLDGAADFIAPHVGKAHIRVANRSFTTLACIASPGVVTSWHHRSVVQSPSKATDPAPYGGGNA